MKESTERFSDRVDEKGGAVIGVEPNGEMRKAAETLLKEFPKFVSTDGTAENTRLADRSGKRIFSRL